MPLIAMKGDSKSVNRRLLLEAFETPPSLILDCGNCADSHALFPMIREEQLHDVYVMNAEAIYRFRDALRQIFYWAQKLKIKSIIITTIHALFSYDDDIENYNVLMHCWELMKELSGRYPLYVGIASDKMHLDFAERFSDNIILV
jgi:hypothetical protein